MSETKDEIAAERDALRAENEQLRAQLASTTSATYLRAANPEPRFELSAGEQHDLQVHGVTRSARTGKAITAEDFPDQVDLDALSDTARDAIARENERRSKAGN
jgi:hypothetical protein